MKMHGNKGTTLIEMVFSLVIVMCGMGLLTTILPLIQNIHTFDLNSEDEVAIRQIRHLLLFGSEIEFYEDELIFFYLGEQVSLTLDMDRLIRRDGYVIYMEGIHNSSFSKKENCFYLNYEKRDKKIQRFIGCQ